MSRILIVDDVPLGIKILGEFLSQEYEVVVATSGPKALEIAEKNPPDLILMDIIMPEMSGLETCRRLRENPRTVAIPVIFLTALSESDDIIRGFEAGGQDYIVKPFKKMEVLVRVQTHIELKKAREKIDQYARELEQKNQELKELLQRVEQMAMNDYLTGVYNCRSAVELIQKELARSQREGKCFSILMADIDDFKQINDKYGHECGDYVLTRVAGLIRDASRQYDVVARWGGEEFLLMLPRTQLEEAKIVAERIRALVAAQVFDYQGVSFSVTLTIGAAGFLPGDDVDGLIRRADKLMYVGKKGKNQVVIEERK